MSADHPKTIPAVARELGISYSHARDLANKLCKPARFGNYMVLTPTDVRRLREHVERTKGVANA